MKKQIFKAKKPCNFNGKKFFIGDTIPSEYVLDPIAQISMGVIEVVEGESNDAAPEEGGPLLPPSSTLDEDQEDADDEQSEESEDQEDAEVTKYSKSTLLRMTKDELVTLAAERGIEVNAEMTKEAIADLILEKQGE